MLSNDKEIQRRTVLKGAAWSVPVIAVAAASPAFGATGSGQGIDVEVSATCTGNYDLGGLFDLIELIPNLGSAVTSTVQALLAAIGLTPVSTRGFIIKAKEGTIPAGTKFDLTPANGLITLTAPALAPILTAGALSLVAINAGTAQIQTGSDITQGNSVTVDLSKGAINLKVGGDSKLKLVGSDSPSNPATAGANEATLSLIAFDTNLGSLIDVSGLGTGILGGIAEAALGALTITVQLCPGQADPRD